MIIAALLIGASDSINAQGRTKLTATKALKSTSTSNNGIRYSYFPTASTTDGRMVSIVGAGLQSMTGDAVEFGIGLPGTTDSLRIGIFDGETSATWDLGTSELVYRLYADSTANGTGTTLLATYYGSSMNDNGWYNIAMAVHPSARSTDTVYFYRLVISLSDATTKTWSNFKLRTNGTAMFLPRAFSFSVPLFSTTEAQILYPNYPSTSTTTYDGTWQFNMAVSEPVEDLEVWDGDMDYGSSDGVYRDTDDADTPNDSVPAWGRNGVAVTEGVATSRDYIIVNGVRSTTTKMSGAPADDNANAWYKRSPAVEYTVQDPNGTNYRNANPSGNLEWERFRISTVATSASDYDYLASVIPTGTYKINMSGMDVGNLNAWRIWYSMLGATDSATAAGTAVVSARNTQGPSTSSFRSHPVILAVDSAGTALRAILPSLASIGGVGNINYWKNSSTNWPVAVITIGSRTYSKSQAQALFAGSTTDISKLLARQLIAAKLNVLSNNASTCIYQTIKDADTFLAANPIGSGTGSVMTGGMLALQLYYYNIGSLSCAVYRQATLD
ncbi:MAG: hypothetical protein H7X80_07350 [bacterium]|nr:hypothetical protein [Candidatus Kapabacteria bacterium]